MTYSNWQFLNVSQLDSQCGGETGLGGGVPGRGAGRGRWRETALEPKVTWRRRGEGGTGTGSQAGQVGGQHGRKVESWFFRETAQKNTQGSNACPWKLVPTPHVSTAGHR